MATINVAGIRKSAARTQAWADQAGRYVVPLGRCFFASIFVMASFGHFTSKTIDSASAHGVPMASILVPISGVLALVGGLSVAIGYRARFGAWLLVLFLVPVTIMMHNFWTFTDPAAAHIQQIMFMKNIALIGGALFLTWFGAGPVSVDRGR